jgi:PIN domain nuclease of toxin-antitoxin system
MRYYLDTNLLIFILSGKNDDIHIDVRHIINDYANICYASSTAICELLSLFKSEKLEFLKFKDETELLSELTERYGIETVYFDRQHFNVYASLQITKDHKDMNDHLIISQAIADKIPLISSDHKFDSYITQGLSFVFNKR